MTYEVFIVYKIYEGQENKDKGVDYGNFCPPWAEIQKPQKGVFAFFSNFIKNDIVYVHKIFKKKNPSIENYFYMHWTD